MTIYRQCIAVLSTTAVGFGLAGCGGGSGGSGGATGNIGTFIDSPVSGIDYQTETLTGTTNTSGEFSYLDGETVTFLIGDINLPPVAAGSMITPLDIVNTQDINDPSVVNIARLLQSLDEDGDPMNGISIADDAHLSATGMSLDFSSPTFDADVTNLVANSGSVTNVLIDESAALAHLQDSLDSAGLLPTPQVGSWYFADENRTLVTFLDESNYFVTQDIDDVGEPLCADGMESGTYVWNPVNGEFSLSNVIDTNGDCGLTSMQGDTYDATVTVSEDTLTVTDVEGSFSLAKVMNANNPIVGSWYFADENTTLVTFLDEANYFVTQDTDDIGEPLCADGMESGTYISDPVNGEFSLSNAIDTTGDCGLTSMQGDTYSATVTVSEDTLTVTDVEGSFELTRVQ